MRKIRAGEWHDRQQTGYEPPPPPRVGESGIPRKRYWRDERLHGWSASDSLAEEMAGERAVRRRASRARHSGKRLWHIPERGGVIRATRAWAKAHGLTK